MKPDCSIWPASVRWPRWMPELKLPDFGDDPIRALLIPVVPRLPLDRRSASRSAHAGHSTLLTPEQIQAVAREAPERIAGPQRQPDHTGL